MLTLKERALKAKGLLNEVGAIATALAAIGTAYFLYMSNIWTPSVTLVSVDYVNGSANLTVNGQSITLYKNENFAAGWGWDVEFGTDYDNAVERVQLVRNLVVYQILSVKQ